MNILTIGGATQDICVAYQHQEIACLDTPEGKQRFLLLLEGAKIELERVAYLPGGGAHNTAVSYARQGFGTSIVCCVGTDCQADFIIDNLTKNNVATNFVVRTDLTTGFSFVITLTTGDRTVLVNRGANLALNHDHLPDSALDGINQLYITSLTGATSVLLPAFVEQAKKRAIPVAVNPGSSQLRADGRYLCKSLSSIDTLILNSYEAMLFMGSLQHAGIPHEQCKQSDARKSVGQQPCLLSPESVLDLRLFFQFVHSHGTAIVVVTNGAEGVYVSAGTCLYFYPSQPMEVVSTLGAGDAFGSGFVGHLVRGGTVQEAIRYGIANSHAVIGNYGAQTGLLTADALDKAVQKLDPSLLQTYL